jgi:hypothetical protein
MYIPPDRADTAAYGVPFAAESHSVTPSFPTPIALAPPHAMPRARQRSPARWAMVRGIVIGLCLSLAWLAASAFEWGTGQRVLPWNAYGVCGTSRPAELPATVRVGLYEEFPAPWRLERLRYVDFPVDLAIAAPSREVFLALRDAIRHSYPHVREVYFWPLLKPEEGYYPGTWSHAAGLRRVAHEAEGLPTLWDLEMPPDLKHPSIRSWPQNRAFFDGWLRSRAEPVHLWRSHASMGLDPLFLRMAGMHFDPGDYPAVSLHLDLYEKGTGMPAEQMQQMLRCGVERYGPRFIPALGVLDDGHGKPGQFIHFETLRRDVQLARAAGVSELWLFSVNGLTPSVVQMLHETLPLAESSQF